MGRVDPTLPEPKNKDETLVIDIKNFFDRELPAAIATKPDEAKQVGASYQLNITGVGEWFVDLKSDSPLVSPGNPGGADCTITLAEEDFQKLSENPQANGMQLFFAGKLKIAGDNMLAMRLSEIFALRG